MPRPLLLALSLVLAWLAAPPPVHAQTTDAGERALTLGKAALELYEQRDWERAHGLFAEANNAYHSPVFVLYMARCQRELGALLDAERLLQEVANEPLADDAPPPFEAAVRDAVAELETLRTELPKLTVNAPDAEAVGIDDKTVSPGEPVAVDPGGHDVWARRGDERIAESINVDRGAAHVIELVFPPPAPPPAPTAPAPEPLPPPAPTTVPDEGADPLFIGGVTLAALGGAGLIVGTATGIVAAGDANDAEERCPDLMCDAEGLARVERGRDYATASTVTLVAGGALSAAGLLMLILPPLLGEGADDLAWIAPEGAGVRWRF